MSIIGVYLPCLDQGLDCYKEHLVELERVVSESELLGPVIVLGNFNAHLKGYVGAGEPNVQEVLLQEVMKRLQLSAVSLGSLASGPGYTYLSGDVRTIVDYVLMDVETVSLLSSYYTHPMEDLNMSDHLPITAYLMYEGCPVDQSCIVNTDPV